MPDPALESPNDAIVQIRLAGLCGSDLHPFFGREVGIDAGTVMGHEFVGEIIEVGEAVTQLSVGDRVAAPFTTSCGHCFYCRAGLTSRCDQGQLFGWRQSGVGLHGGQATMIRVPLAEGTLVKIPEQVSDETALLAGDNLSTGFFAAEMAGVSAGGVFAVIGCGTVGLLTILAAKRLGAREIVAVDPNEARLAIARQLGAETAALDQAVRIVHARTDRRGADAVMELVGLPDAQSLAIQLVRPGGTLSVIGCHCTPHFAFSPSQAYDKNLTYRTGRCPAHWYMGKLLDQLQQAPLDLSWCITHRFPIDDAERAYEVFAGRMDGCVKAVLEC